MRNSYYVPEQQQQSPPLLQPPQTPAVPCMDHLPYADNYLSPASHYPSPSSPTDFPSLFPHHQQVDDIMPDAPWMHCEFDTFHDHHHHGPTQVGAADQCESPLQLHASQSGSYWPDPASAPFSASSSSLLSHIEAQAQLSPTHSLPYTNRIEFRHHHQSAIPPADPIPTSAPPSPVNTTGASSTTATSPVTTSSDHASIPIRLSPSPGTSGKIDVEVSCEAGSSTGADGDSSSPASVNTANGNRKPPLACLFCRGRKIACGPPPPESTDKTCK
jgi:hypothetical protein